MFPFTSKSSSSIKSPTIKKRQEKLIDKYVNAKCKSTKKRSILVSLKRETRSTRLSFFMQLAYWHLKCKGKLSRNITEYNKNRRKYPEIIDVGKKYYERY